MKEYKRLTQQGGIGRFVKDDCITCKSHRTDKDGCDFCCGDEDSNNWCCGVLYNRLAELEDDIESGKLIRLPCKVGDTVWFINAYNKDIVEAVVTRIVFNGEICIEAYGDYKDYIVLEKGCFLTKAEAEKKLAELKGE